MVGRSLRGIASSVCSGGSGGGDASSHLELSESGFKQLVIILMCLGFILTGIFTSILIFEELYLEGGYQKEEVYLPAAGVPTGMAVLISGKGSLKPLGRGPQAPGHTVVEQLRGVSSEKWVWW